MTTSNINRGALIVFEGCDRCGKSTQANLLVESLRNKGEKVEKMSFPERQSDIGKTINAYLRNGKDLPSEVIHLLFTANRWEFQAKLRQLMEGNTTLVVDRYSYSGVAYSVAKGLRYDWCMGPEKGLIRPDVVFFLKSPVDTFTERASFGEERYEKVDFQTKVSKVFNRICEEEEKYWHTIDASLSVEVIEAEIYAKTLQTMNEVRQKPLIFL